MSPRIRGYIVREVDLISALQCGASMIQHARVVAAVSHLNLEQCCYASITLASSPVLNVIVASPTPLTLYHAILKRVANAMQCAEGFVLERDLV